MNDTSISKVQPFEWLKCDVRIHIGLNMAILGP